jgi:hypothetical protein
MVLELSWQVPDVDIHGTRRRADRGMSVNFASRRNVTLCAVCGVLGVTNRTWAPKEVHHTDNRKT